MTKKINTTTKYQIQKGSIKITLNTYKSLIKNEDENARDISNYENKMSNITTKTFDTLEEAEAAFEIEKNCCTSYVGFLCFGGLVNVEFIKLVEIKYEVDDDEEILEEISCECLDVFYGTFWSNEYFEEKMNIYLSNYYEDHINFLLSTTADYFSFSRINRELLEIKNFPLHSQLFIDCINYAVEDVWSQEVFYDDIDLDPFLSIFKKTYYESVWYMWEAEFKKIKCEFSDKGNYFYD